MAALRSMIVLGMCLSYAYSATVQCDQAIQQFEQCLRSGEKGREGQGQGQDRQKFEQDMKNCFTSNGCDVPQPPQGGRGQQGGNDNNRQCHQAIESKTKDAMLQCMRRTDSTFNFPKEEGHGGPGGPHGDDHDHEGGHQGGFGGAGGQDGEQFLLKTCKGSQANADKAKACLMNAFKSQAPDQAAMKAEIAARCQAKSQCESKLGSTCKDVMEQRAKAMCNCDQEADSKRPGFMQQEPSCQSVQQPNGGKEKQRDCNQKPRDFCQQQG